MRLRHCLFFLPLLLLATASSPLAAAWSSVSCGDSSYAANSTYEANLGRLSAIVPAELASAPHRSYLSRAVGYWPNRLQAVSSCWSGDGDDCAACIANAFKQVQRKCLYRREAYFYDDDCNLQLDEFRIFRRNGIFGCPHRVRGRKRYAGLQYQKAKNLLHRRTRSSTGRLRSLPFPGYTARVRRNAIVASGLASSRSPPAAVVQLASGAPAPPRPPWLPWPSSCRRRAGARKPWAASRRAAEARGELLRRQIELGGGLIELAGLGRRPSRRPARRPGRRRRPPAGGRGRRLAAGAADEEDHRGGSGRRPPAGAADEEDHRGGSGRRPPAGGRGRRPPAGAARGRGGGGGGAEARRTMGEVTEK